MTAPRAFVFCAHAGRGHNPGTPREVTMRTAPAILLVALLAVASLNAPPALAMGGMSGGGGGMGTSSPKIDPQKAYQDGVAALNAHDYKTAINRLSDAHDALPHDATVNYALGVAYVGDNN